MTGIAYELNHIRKQYQGRCVLDIDSLGLEAGKCHVIVGPNGAGKTTLMEVLAMLLPPDSGRLSFLGNVVPARATAMAAARKSVVMVAQDPLMFSMSVLCNVAYGLRLRGIGKREREKMAMAAIERVGMSRFAHAQAHTLSGGETRRVALARAMALTPEVLICDEPTSGVDIEHRNAVLDLLLGMCGSHGTTVVLSTHHPDHTQLLSCNILHMAGGRLMPWGPVNRFAGTANPETEDQTRIRFYSGCELRVSGIWQGDVVFSVDPGQIDICTSGACTCLSPNRLQGRLESVSAIAGGVRLIVDAGARFAVDLPMARYDRMCGFRIGEWVWLGIPDAAVTVAADTGG